MASALLPVEVIDRMIPWAAYLAVLLWVLLTAGMQVWVPPELFVRLAPDESWAAFIAMLIMVTSALLIGVSCVLRSAKNWSGIVVAACIVQGISILTNYLLAFRPSPVAFDAVTNSRVFLHRWCEWIPLSGLMTFLSDVVDLRSVPDDQGNPRYYQALKWPVMTALCQTLSCACAVYFPFAEGIYDWSAAMTFSMITYLVMFPRLYYKHRDFKQMGHAGISVKEQEDYERCRFARNLFAVCTFVWTLLVLFYFVNMAIMTLLPQDHFLHWPPLAMIVDTTFDVIAKAAYMKVIVEAHVLVFDKDLRAQRQLGELRQLMDLLWKTSSDIIIITIKNDATRATSLLSPAFVKLLDETAVPPTLKDATALRLETSHDAIDKRKETSSRVCKASYVNYNSLQITGNGARLRSVPKQDLVLDPSGRIPLSALQLVDSVWRHCPNKSALSKSPRLFVHTLDRIDSEGSVGHFEVQVNQHKDNSLVAVVRDVTERYRRFEAERRAHAETRARQRDALNVNKFTRHEIKNGLLNGIELCSSLSACLDDAAYESSSNSSSGNGSHTQSGEIPSRVARALTTSREYVAEMEAMLSEVLDIVLAEATARDVIHEVYHPKPEQVDVMALFGNYKIASGSRSKHSLEAGRLDMPTLMLDPQLVRHIHRNATSNAFKYGRAGGKVLTRVNYLDETKEFLLQVINEPGEGHLALVEMGKTAEEAIFSQGSRLHPHTDMKGAKISAGDGAWIMQKCAKCLGGKCSIEFLETLVVFSFRCPADRYVVTNESATSDFEVPQETWGIGIDDSKMQRRVLGKILTHGGVDESRQIIVGAKPADIAGLFEVITKILSEHRNTRIVMLIDENLDYGALSGGVLSGSLEVRQILQRLDPEQRDRVLAVVRSANDSAEDVSLYSHRLHGFFPKTIMKKNEVRKALSSLWIERFPPRPDITYVSEESNVTNTDDVGLEDIQESLEHVNTVLRTETDSSTSDQGRGAPAIVTDESWARIWQALHSLRGDLMVLGNESEKLLEAIRLISEMKGPIYPDDFPLKWERVQELMRDDDNSSTDK